MTWPGIEPRSPNKAIYKLIFAKVLLVVAKINYQKTNHKIGYQIKEKKISFFFSLHFWEFSNQKIVTIYLYLYIYSFILSYQPNCIKKKKSTIWTVCKWLYSIDGE